MIKAVLFDLDGVVIDSEPLYEQVEGQLLKQYGISIGHEHQEIFKGITETAFYDLLEKKYRPNWDRKQVVSQGRRLLLELFATELRFVPGFVSLIDRIEGRYLTGLVTSTPRQTFDEISRILPIKKYFEAIICADDILDGKPHPEPYLSMAKLLSVSPEETLVIEDSVHGIRSARDAGAVCVALATSFSRDQLREAHKVVESLDEIDDHLIRDLGKGNDRLVGERNQGHGKVGDRDS